MRFCRKSIWLLVAVAVLLPAGCVSQRGGLARKDDVNTAQLLAAARQYEKEGQLQNAAHIYQHVLKYHPSNFEAKEGLALVQQGKLRVDYNTQELLASTDPSIRTTVEARKQLALQRKEKRDALTGDMAQLIAEAAKNPQKIEIDPAPTPVMTASVARNASEPKPLPAASITTAAVEAKPAPATSITTAAVEAEPAPAASVTTAAVEAKPAPAASVDTEPIISPAEKSHSEVAPQETVPVAQADAVAAELPQQQIETTAFDAADESTAADSPTSESPADQTEDTGWQARSLVDKCADANAAVLAEVKKLESDADDVRKEGLTRLALMGPEASSAEPAIVRLLNDQNQLVQAHAAWALCETGADAQTAVELLAKHLGGGNNEVVQFAAYTLGNMGDTAAAAVPALHQLLSAENSLTQLHAAEALTLIADAEERADATDTLIVLLMDENAKIRALAAMTLGQVDEANAAVAVAALTSALDDEVAGVRSAAALSLGAYGSVAKEAIAKLEAAAKADQSDVREAAESALACIKL